MSMYEANFRTFHHNYCAFADDRYYHDGDCQNDHDNIMTVMTLTFDDILKDIDSKNNDDNNDLMI